MNKTFSFMREKDNEKERLDVKIVTCDDCSKGQFLYEKSGLYTDKFHYKSEVLTSKSDWDAMNLMLNQIQSFLHDINVYKRSEFTDYIWKSFFDYKQPNLDEIKIN